MKTFFLTLLFIFSLIDISLANESISHRNLKEVETDWSLLANHEIEEFIRKGDVQKREKIIKIISAAKEMLLRGDTKKAHYLLSKIDIKRTKLRPIVLRFQALTYFIENDYNKALKILSHYDFDDPKYYKEVCMLKIIAQIPKGPSKNLEKDIILCQNSTFKYTNNDHFWLETIYSLHFDRERLLKGNALSDFQWILSTKEYVRIWLKTGLFINRENYVESFIHTFPAYLYESEELRELIGLMYYRMGNKEKAMQFIEDLNGPNAENIKGNINLEEKKYELAFGHFQLALQTKKNSKNALERAIPLAWLLGQWEEGIRLLKKSINPTLDQRKKFALDTAFKIKAKKFEQANDQILILNNLYELKAPFEIELMIGHMNMVANENELLKKSIEKTCKLYDGMSCWLQMQTLIWDNLPKTSKREDKLHPEIENFVDELKSAQGITPLEEQVNIDQRDIEELDGELLSL
ncbi:hypothetical protein HBN50_08460 [Halobacteriovorax sp. GB3]|uniref:hypothetical protein n=1 Tax=Halobacteriovorax sp. GB3 TaxID=2719615 RepID=UPI00235EC71F|nr:hypothetical protein [Halobacteriovorax sp. GB3]MDD0853126.1 hypothetical protein [Halobacteriovorax sp. GB3]